MSGLDANTKLLLHCDGIDEATSFPDASPSNHTITAGSNAQVDTAVKKWGTGSALFARTDDILSTPDHADWDIFGSNTTNRTVDFQVRHTDHAGTERYICQWEGNNDYWVITHTHGFGIQLLVVTGGVAVLTTTLGGEIADTNIHHIALCKVANDYGMYKDSVQQLFWGCPQCYSK